MDLEVRVTINQGGRSHMEDEFFIWKNKPLEEGGEVFSCFGVFDGHGGEHASIYAKRHLFNNVVSKEGFWSKDDDQVFGAIRKGFSQTHFDMWKEQRETWPKRDNGMLSTAGTTATVIFIKGTKIYGGHVGDSRVVLGYSQSGSDYWAAHQLTTDHKPYNEEELRRINSNGGKLDDSGKRVVWTRPSINHAGPILRSTKLYDLPFLALSRALGDFWSFSPTTYKFIVSPEPDVFVVDLKGKSPQCIILGSDGIWDMISSEESVQFVQWASLEQKDPSEVLAEASEARWEQRWCPADNMTAMTIMIKPKPVASKLFIEAATANVPRMNASNTKKKRSRSTTVVSTVVNDSMEGRVVINASNDPADIPKTGRISRRRTRSMINVETSSSNGTVVELTELQKEDSKSVRRKRGVPRVKAKANSTTSTSPLRISSNSNASASSASALPDQQRSPVSEMIPSLSQVQVGILTGRSRQMRRSDENIPNTGVTTSTERESEMSLRNGKRRVSDSISHIAQSLLSSKVDSKVKASGRKRRASERKSMVEQVATKKNPKENSKTAKQHRSDDDDDDDAKTTSVPTRKRKKRSLVVPWKRKLRRTS